MSMMQQPHPPSPPSVPQDRSWLSNERDHMVEMPLPTLCLLVLPSLLLFILDPLLPIMAYVLQRWAGSSWTWRDQWASVGTWAKQGAWVVALLVALAWLAAAHVLFFPALIAGLQTAWLTAHLPGDLSLSPLDASALVARTLLLLPLAPALSLYYERIDPRTPMDLQRVLTPTDLVVPQQATPVSPPTSTNTAHEATSTPDQAPAQTSTNGPSAPPKVKRPKTASSKQQQATTKPVEQRTIDSVLAPDQAQASPSTPTPTPSVSPRGAGRTRTGAKHPTTGNVTTQDTQQKPPGIDWDDVAE